MDKHRAIMTALCALLLIGLTGVASAAIAAQTPYNGPHTVPGRVQAEDYDNGGAGIAYSDTTTTNTGRAGRLYEQVDVATVNGITSISSIVNNEWTEYTVQVPASGTYTTNFRVASPEAGRLITLSVDGTQQFWIRVANTGSYTYYKTISAPLSTRLTAGTHVIRLTYQGTGQNLDWFEIVGPSTTSGATPVPTTVTTTAPTIIPTTVPTTIRTTVPTTVPPTVVTTVPTAVPTAVPTTLSPAPSTAELQARMDAAYASGNARLASMQAAYRAWSVPTRSDLIAVATNARTSGLKSDGSTDNTAAFRTLLNTLPAGATLYFPAGTYRINGPISITKPITIVGEPGTIFNCQGATGHVFTINQAGSASSKMGGVTFTGLVIEGPGIETNPAMINAYYLSNFKVTSVKFHNVGYAAIRLNSCTDATIQSCVFDNVFKTGYGYGVAIVDANDRITVRDSFFVTKGRHSVTMGYSSSAVPASNYPRSVTIENNYFENTLEEAINAHNPNIGPDIIRNNVMYACGKGVQLGNGIADVSGNAIINCKAGVYLWNYDVARTQIGAKTDRVVGNTMINTLYEAVIMANTNVQILDNVAKGSNGGGAIIFNGNPPTSSTVRGNVVESYTRGLQLSTSMPGIASTNNYLKASGTFRAF